MKDPSAGGTREERETVVDQLRRILSDEIVTGMLGSCVRLDEQSLADRFAVSRTPVREKLSQLSPLRLVEKRPHKGAAFGRAKGAELVPQESDCRSF